MKTMTPDVTVSSEYDFSRGVRGNQQEKFSLSLAGDFFVAAELNRRGIFASVTYGAARNADVFVLDQQTSRTAVLEVKTTTSAQKKWLVRSHSRHADEMRPDQFWIFVLLPAFEDTTIGPRYFVLTSDELFKMMACEENVRSLSLSDVEAQKCEGQWGKITQWLESK